ncbi:hypothetical protein [Maritimibacter alkaliphilus]|uniref:hypothetical protein n=1 Tax=Maritimibacter alkaliphilus TaxID=404236 RepID=UPI001C971F56|nr:hypothetical protein [Maritimibacter alkaliphilus]MBY6089256.1 hypothetical protein [Maritimibacter alkaliphilus]
MNEKKASDARIRSCIRFIADSYTYAHFYLQSDWVKFQALEAAGFDPRSLGSEAVKYFEERDLFPDLERVASDAPSLMYINDGALIDGDPYNGAWLHESQFGYPKRELVLSSSPDVHKAHLRDSGLNAQTAILCLAACGLDVMLPNVSFSEFSDDEVERLKEDFVDERVQYLDLASSIAEQAFERLQAKDYSEVMRWAESEVAFKLVPQARKIEQAIGSASAQRLRKAGYSFWRDGTPAIGSAWLMDGAIAGGIAAGSELLRAVVTMIDGAREERSMPEVAYAIKISKAERQRSLDR